VMHTNGELDLDHQSNVANQIGSGPLGQHIEGFA